MAVIMGVALPASADDNVLQIDDFTVAPGTQPVVSVKMNNTASISSIQFDLVLPTGVTIAKDEYGDCLVDLSTSRTSSRRHMASCVERDGNIYHISVQPTGSYVFSGTSGEVLQVTLDIAADLANSRYFLNVVNQKLQELSGAMHSPENFDVAMRSSDGQEAKNTLRIADFTLEAGKQVKIPVLMTNTADIAVLQFDLKIPEGFVLACDSYGDALIDISTDRTTSRQHVVSYKTITDGFVRIVVTSPHNAVFAGKSGAVVEFTVDVPRALEAGDYTFELKNMVLTTPSLNEYRPADATGTCHLTKTIVKVSEIAIPNDCVFVYVNNTVHFPAEALPQKAEVRTLTWSSEDPNICTVDADGNITAVSRGVTKVHAYANDDSGIEAECKVLTAEIADGPLYLYDINRDGHLSISDVNELIEYILEKK